MRTRNIIESVIGLPVMGLSIYLSFNFPNRDPSPSVIFMFMVGLIGSLAPYLRLSKREGVK